MNVRHNPLETRTFRFKKAHMEFYCPLCGTQRAMVTSPHLSAMNYLQITMLTIVVSACLYPFMEFHGLFSFFPIWAMFEAALRINFRKEVPCPHCGFDASWYKTDVKVARQKVDEFWDGRNISSTDKHTTHTNEEILSNEAP